MTLGKYVNNDTLLHRLDPRNKFILLFVYMVLIFLINPTKVGFEAVGWIAYAVLLILLLVTFNFGNKGILLYFLSLIPLQLTLDDSAIEISSLLLSLHLMLSLFPILFLIILIT